MWNFVRGGDGRFKFFRLELGGEQLRQEVFYLAYYLHWQWSEIMEMDINPFMVGGIGSASVAADARITLNSGKA